MVTVENKVTSLMEACVAHGMRMTEQRPAFARVPETAGHHPDVVRLHETSARRHGCRLADQRLDLSAIPLDDDRAPPKS